MDLYKAFVEAEKVFENLEKEFFKANLAEKAAIKKIAKKLVKSFEASLGIWVL